MTLEVIWNGDPWTLTFFWAPTISWSCSWLVCEATLSQVQPDSPGCCKMATPRDGRNLDLKTFLYGAKGCDRWIGYGRAPNNIRRDRKWSCFITLFRTKTMSCEIFLTLSLNDEISTEYCQIRITLFWMRIMLCR